VTADFAGRRTQRSPGYTNRNLLNTDGPNRRRGPFRFGPVHDSAVTSRPIRHDIRA
jgi:hypothetical protein